MTWFWICAVNSCVATEQKLRGEDVFVTSYVGSNVAEKDASCCQLCSENPACEFWFRATDSSVCWLKKNSTGEVSSGTTGSTGAIATNQRGGARASDIFMHVFEDAYLSNPTDIREFNDYLYISSRGGVRKYNRLNGEFIKVHVDVGSKLVSSMLFHTYIGRVNVGE